MAQKVNALTNGRTGINTRWRWSTYVWRALRERTCVRVDRLAPDPGGVFCCSPPPPPQEMAARRPGRRRVGAGASPRGRGRQPQAAAGRFDPRIGWPTRPLLIRGSATYGVLVCRWMTQASGCFSLSCPLRVRPGARRPVAGPDSTADAWQLDVDPPRCS
jgi:hypothetical protein